MSQTLSRPYPISFLDNQDFLQHPPSLGRLDKPVNADVTLSAIPDPAGTTRWEARTASGTTLPTFSLTLEPIQGAFGGPVTIPGDGFTYVCYEDEAQKRSWCIRVRTD